MQIPSNVGKGIVFFERQSESFVLKYKQSSIRVVDYSTTIAQSDRDFYVCNVLCKIFLDELKKLIALNKFVNFIPL